MKSKRQSILPLRRKELAILHPVSHQTHLLIYKLTLRKEKEKYKILMRWKGRSRKAEPKKSHLEKIPIGKYGKVAKKKNSPKVPER
jgi:hypothetical protein